VQCKPATSCAHESGAVAVHTAGKETAAIASCYLTINREQSNFLMELLEHIQYPPSIPKYLFALTF
jgi:hypothetical protein